MSRHSNGSGLVGALALVLASGCGTDGAVEEAVESAIGGADGPVVAKSRRRVARPRMLPGQHIPDVAEVEASQAIAGRVIRGTRAFESLVRVSDPRIVFKAEEGTDSDRYMTKRLRRRLRRLAVAVQREWPGVRLRVTEAWDGEREHGRNSLHYEGRAADLTTSDIDQGKLGRLARLAVAAGFDWVYFEHGSHVHVSVRP